MRKSVKKLFGLIGVFMCLLCSTITAHAETINFNVTPPDDPYSYAAKKADSEQYFYVTGTDFTKTAILYCTSQKLTNHSVFAETSIYKNNSLVGTRTSSQGKYKRYAKSGAEYEMYTTSSISGMNVIGRYTP